jgi:hypothetical protein
MATILNHTSLRVNAKFSNETKTCDYIIPCEIEIETGGHISWNVALGATGIPNLQTAYIGDGSCCFDNCTAAEGSAPFSPERGIKPKKSQGAWRIKRSAIKSLAVGWLPAKTSSSHLLLVMSGLPRPGYWNALARPASHCSPEHPTGYK